MGSPGGRGRQLFLIIIDGCFGGVAKKKDERSVASPNPIYYHVNLKIYRGKRAKNRGTESSRGVGGGIFAADGWAGSSFFRGRR